RRGLCGVCVLRRARKRSRPRLPQGRGRAALLRDLPLLGRALRQGQGRVQIDQPGRAVRSICLHAPLGGELPAALLARKLARAHEPVRRRIHLALPVLGRAAGGRGRAPERPPCRARLSDRGPRRRHRSAVRRGPPRGERFDAEVLLGCQLEAPLISSGFHAAFRPPPEDFVLRPEPHEFGRLAAQGNLVPVVREILADLDTPLSLFRALDDGSTSFLLESVEGGEKWARYSFIGTGARALFRAHGRNGEWVEGGVTRRFEAPGDPLEVLRARLAEYRPVVPPGLELPRFTGGAVGMI